MLTIYSVWGVADGSRIASVDAEIVAYAVLDILAKPVFGFWLLFTHDSMSKYVVPHIFRNIKAYATLVLPRSRASGLMVLARKVAFASVRTRTVHKLQLSSNLIAVGSDVSIMKFTINNRLGMKYANGWLRLI